MQGEQPFGLFPRSGLPAPGCRGMPTSSQIRAGHGLESRTRGGDPGATPDHFSASLCVLSRDYPSEPGVAAFGPEDVSAGAPSNSPRRFWNRASRNLLCGSQPYLGLVAAKW
jgi:hypothetical protein